MTNVTCGLTAKKPGSATCPMLVIEYRTTLLECAEMPVAAAQFTVKADYLHNDVLQQTDAL